MSTINVLVASYGPRRPGGLEHLPSYRYYSNSTLGWALASNQLLEYVAEDDYDALFLDDDVTLTAGCLDGVRAHYAAADVFGLDLHAMDGTRQQGARHILDANGVPHDWVAPGPAYVAHCSTSAIYLKAAAVRALRFPIWPGMHWEDVAFCLDAWLHGLKVLAVPGLVHHAIEGGVGATKRHDDAFWPKWRMNMEAMTVWMREHDVAQALADGRIPIGAKPL